MDSFKDPFLQILIIGLLIYFYEKYWTNYSQKRQVENRSTQLFIFFLTSVSIFLCMSFSIHLSSGYYYDLRIIPFLIGILYGGLWVGLADMAVIIITRLVIGGGGVLTTSVLTPILYGTAAYFSLHFKHYSKLHRMIVASSLSLLYGILTSATFMTISDRIVYPVDLNIFLFFIKYCLVLLIMMLFVIHMIENFHENVKMRADIQQSEKFQMIGELAASVAHEIRNPMTVAKGFVQLLQRDELPLEKKDEYMNLILKELERAHFIINDYLSLAKPQCEKVIQINVKERLQYITNVLHSYALLQNVDIEVHLQDSLFVLADPDKFAQVFINIGKNAIEAMPDGGKLVFHTSIKDELVQIEVKDTGVGMTQDTINRLGAPFYSTKDKGTGIGLTVCYRIIQQLGGKICVVSEVGKGAHFKVTLPSARLVE